MPKYINPADYLLKIAHDPLIIRKDIDKVLLVKEANLQVKAAKKEFKMKSDVAAMRENMHLIYQDTGKPFSNAIT